MAGVHVSRHVENDSQVDGIRYSVSHTTARPLIEGWTEDPEPPNEPECTAAGDPYALTADTDLSDPEVLAAAQALVLHGEAINSGHYESAFAMFTPRMQESMGGLEEWSSGLDTSYWIELTLTDSAALDESVELRMTLRTVQSSEYGPEGLECSDWDLTYVLLWQDDLQEYLIDQVRLENEPEECST